MTKRFLKLLGPALAVATMAVSSVPAEAGDIRFRAPFDFTVRGKVLPAGTYDVSETRGILALHSEKGGAFVQTSRMGSSRDRNLRVVFEKYGETYVLRQAWTGAGGFAVPQSRSERELARAGRAGQSAAVELVVIPAL